MTQIPHCDLCAKGTRRCRATMRATHTCTMVESRENSSQHAHIHDCRGLLLRVLALERHCAKKCFCAHHQRVERGCVRRLSREACTAAVITVSTGLGFLRCMRGSSKLSGRRQASETNCQAVDLRVQSATVTSVSAERARPARTTQQSAGARARRKRMHRGGLSMLAAAIFLADARMQGSRR